MKPERKTKTRRKGKHDAFLCIIGILLIIAILLLTWKIVNYLIDERKSRVFFKDLQNSVIIMDEGEQKNGDAGSEQDATGQKDGKVVSGQGAGEQENGEAVPEQDTEEYDNGEAVPEQDTEERGKAKIPIAINFDSLYEISKDAVAWLYSPDTEINYVVAQAEDNDYYLHHLLDGMSARGGTLFTDYRNNADFTDWNTVIYGHNMKNGTMFASLMDYRRPDYYEEHPVMYLYMPEHRYKLELIAGYTTNINDLIYSIPVTKEERDEIIDHACMVSSFLSGITIGEEDKLVTLSTCTYAYDDARYVVIGRIVEE